MVINLNEINEIEIPNNGNLDFELKDGKLIIDSKINGMIVDSNFKELTKEIIELKSIVDDLESQIKMKINGELRRLSSKVDKI